MSDELKITTVYYKQGNSKKNIQETFQTILYKGAKNNSLMLLGKCASPQLLLPTSELDAITLLIQWKFNLGLGLEVGEKEGEWILN